jgi:hypothetical protein
MELSVHDVCNGFASKSGDGPMSYMVEWVGALIPPALVAFLLAPGLVLIALIVALLVLAVVVMALAVAILATPYLLGSFLVRHWRAPSLGGRRPALPRALSEYAQPSLRQPL